MAQPTPTSGAALPAPSSSDRPARPAPRCRRRSAEGRGSSSGLYVQPRSREALLPAPVGAGRFFHPSHPPSVGLARHLVGALRRRLVKHLDSNGWPPGYGHILIDGGLAAVSRTQKSEAYLAHGNYES